MQLHAPRRRAGGRAQRPPRPASSGTPTATAIAAAARAFSTWWAPLWRSVTGCHSPAWPSSNDGRSRSSTSTPRAVTSPPGPKVRTAGVGAARHGGDQVVVGVEHGRAVGRQRLDDLALGLRDRLARAELADVGGADVEHGGDLRRRDLAQVGDVPDPPGAHLDHEVAGLGVGGQHGQWDAELVVVVAAVATVGPAPAEHLGQVVLGAGLALRAGQGEDGRVAAGRRRAGPAARARPPGRRPPRSARRSGGCRARRGRRRRSRGRRRARRRTATNRPPATAARLSTYARSGHHDVGDRQGPPCRPTAAAISCRVIGIISTSASRTTSRSSKGCTTPSIS